MQYIWLCWCRSHYANRHKSFACKSVVNFEVIGATNLRTSECAASRRERIPLMTLSRIANSLTYICVGR